MNLECITFSKQFILANRDLLKRHPHPFPIDPIIMDIDSEACLVFHKDLSVCIAKSDGKMAVCIGSILDTNDPSQSNDSIINGLLSECNNFDKLHLFIDRFAGKWILIVYMDGQRRVYHDAGGLKGVFFWNSDKGSDVVCASQPILLEKMGLVCRNHKMMEEIIPAIYAAWPMNLVPYEGIVRLLPNHYLDLSRGTSHRYYPRHDMEDLPVEDAATEVSRLLFAVIDASVQRWPCTMAITGGYDSRVLVACANGLRDRIKFYLAKSRATPRFDAVLPARIAHRLNINLKIQEVSNAAEAPLHQVLAANCSDMFYDNSINLLDGQRIVVGGSICLEGLLGEVGRSFYKSHFPDASATPEGLAKCSHSKPIPAIIDGNKRWLESLPKFDIDVLDLYYWENRIGIWASSGLAYKEAVVDIYPPYNCRAILDTFLRVRKDARMPPYPLFRRIIEKTEPSLTDIPFNWTFLGSLQEKAPLPWRMKRWLGWI